MNFKRWPYNHFWLRAWIQRAKLKAQQNRWSYLSSDRPLRVDLCPSQLARLSPAPQGQPSANNGRSSSLLGRQKATAYRFRSHLFGFVWVRSYKSHGTVSSAMCESLEATVTGKFTVKCCSDPRSGIFSTKSAASSKWCSSSGSSSSTPSAADFRNDRIKKTGFNRSKGSNSPPHGA
ncbi:hypothetical protein HDE79_001889 [Rhodanobacter sp. MP1X3]|nr:hypothetical protein [Rhodanobacter sp. MP1X3]